MLVFKLLASVLATTTTVLASSSPISLVSWSDPRVDLFGIAPDTSIWHKFYTGSDWQPAYPYFQRLPATAKGKLAVSSWAEGHLDILYLNASGSNLLHKYFAGGGWGPSFDGQEDLGGEGLEGVVSACWGEGRLDVVAVHANGSYLHKAWTGDGWFPSVTGWESFGGEFYSAPAVVSWGKGRLDIVGFNAENGSLSHMYYQDGWSKWEDLGGGPFVGNPVATSWGEGRLDFWAIDSDGALNHLYWDGTQYKGWEKLGGEFTDTPRVVHWNVSKIDIVGKGIEDQKYYLKSFDGSKWNPEGEKWYDLAGPYGSEPALLAKNETNFLYVFGIDEADSLRMNIWTGYDWQPGHNATWPVGDLAKPYAPPEKVDQQKVLGSLEL